MRGFHKLPRATQGKSILFASFLFGIFCFTSGAVSPDFLYNVFSVNIIKIIFGFYIFSGCFLVLVANLYLVLSGHGLVPMRGSLHKTPPVVRISYRYFYLPIFSWGLFLAGGALGIALF